jgi:hypothetical protein
MQRSISLIYLNNEGPLLCSVQTFFSMSSAQSLEVSPEIFCLSEPCGGRYHEDDNIFRHHTASLQLWRIQIKIIKILNISTALHVDLRRVKGKVPREFLL